MSLPTPNTRKEQYLNAIATGNAGGLPTPITREEEYLDAIAKSGGGSGDGDMKKSVYDSDLDVAGAGGIKAFVSDAVSGKVDKVEGKGLSTNDYDNTEKGKVADNTGAIEAITENGCCNILPNNATSQTIQGRTVVVNADGSVDVSGAGDGTDAYIMIQQSISLDLNRTYVLSGCPSGGNINSYYMTYSNNYDVDYKEYGDGQRVECTPFNINTYPAQFVGIVIRGGYAIQGTLTFKPMLYDARLNPTGYVPYAMTNRELTDKVHDKVVGLTQYTDDNPYNVWTTHTVNITGFTTIKSITISPLNPTLIADGTLHDAVLITFTNNSVTYAVKGGWSGGMNGVSVSLVICGE